MPDHFLSQTVVLPAQGDDTCFEFGSDASGSPPLWRGTLLVEAIEFPRGLAEGLLPVV